MPILNVPVIKDVRTNWLATPQTIDVTINTHKWLAMYEVSGTMVHANKKDNEGNPYTYLIPPMVKTIPAITLATVKLPPAVINQFGHLVPLPSGRYTCTAVVKLGWKKRVMYWRGFRDGFGFAAFKVMFVADPQYPVLSMSKEVDWD